MLKAIKVRLYLTKEQKAIFARLFGCNRLVYNQLLSYKDNQYKEHGKSLNRKDLQKYFHSGLTSEYEFLQEFNTNILKYNVQTLNTAFKRFYKGVSGFPNFKCKSNEQSVRFINPTCISDYNLDNGKINLTKNLKNLEFRTSKKYTKYILKNRKSIKNITVSKTPAGNYYAAILFDKENIKLVKEPKNLITGLDLGIKTLVTGSNGEIFENKHLFKKEEKKIKKLQRKLSKKKKGSKNRIKARTKLAKVYEDITNKKQYYLDGEIRVR